jgi:hypothetical protein
VFSTIATLAEARDFLLISKNEEYGLPQVCDDLALFGVVCQQLNTICVELRVAPTINMLNVTQNPFLYPICFVKSYNLKLKKQNLN